MLFTILLATLAIIALATLHTTRRLTARTFVIVLAAACLGALTEDAVDQGWLLGLDGMTARAISGLQTALAHKIAQLVTDMAATPAFAACAAGLTALAWWRGERDAAARIVGASVTMEITLVTMKHVIDRARPPAGAGRDASFPSGHTADAILLAAIGTTLALRWISRGPARAAVIGVMTTWALFVALSRLVLGVHYATEVLASIVLALLVACLFLPCFTGAWGNSAVRPPIFGGAP